MLDFLLHMEMSVLCGVSLRTLLWKRRGFPEYPHQGEMYNGDKIRRLCLKATPDLQDVFRVRLLHVSPLLQGSSPNEYMTLHHLTPMTLIDTCRVAEESGRSSGHQSPRDPGRILSSPRIQDTARGFSGELWILGLQTIVSSSDNTRRSPAVAGPSVTPPG